MRPQILSPTLNPVSAPPTTDVDKIALRNDSAVAPPPAAPVQFASAVEPIAPEPSAAEVRQAIHEINASMRAMSRNLEFSVDPDSDRIIVRIVDQQTNEVIRQMPSREALDIAKALDKVKGLLFSQRA